MTVVTAGGMRKAAERLHVQQPAISKAIAQLEDAVGYPLLDRSRQGVAVTPYGQALIKRAAIMFDALFQGARDLEHLADPDGGEISVAGSEPVNAGLLAAAVERMSMQYPRVNFNVDSGETPALISRFLLERTSDFVITRPYETVSDPAIRAEPLYFEKLRLVVGHTSRFAHRRKLTLAELVEEPWILSRNEASGSSPVVQTFQHAGLQLPRCKLLSGRSTYAIRCSRPAASSPLCRTRYCISLPGVRP